MPRRRRRSTSSDLMTPDEDDDSFNNEDFSPNSTDRCPPQQRNAANARERARMRVLSKAFCRLKTTLPWVPADTKLSKLDTLRLASGYIAHLRTLLADQPSDDLPQTGRPLNLTWPFTFQQGAPGAWAGASLTPSRTVSPRISPEQQYSLVQTHQHLSDCDPSLYNNNNNFFARNSQYQQNDNNYYDQIQRENFLKHTYSESMLHSG